MTSIVLSYPPHTTVNPIQSAPTKHTTVSNNDTNQNSITTTTKNKGKGKIQAPPTVTVLAPLVCLCTCHCITTCMDGDIKVWTGERAYD